MITRRSLITAAGAAASALTVPMATSATTRGDTRMRSVDPKSMSPDELHRHAVRYSTLDNESHSNFIGGYKNNHGVMYASPFNSKERVLHTERFLKERGVTLGETDMSAEECWNLLMQDPVYATWTRLYMSGQHAMWARAAEYFHSQEDKYLSLMEATDRKGPGSLQLDKGLNLPDYTRYEIHTQPGGYVGDPFAGWLYHYGLAKGFFQGLNDNDEIYLSIAQSHPLPRDGKVRRILDIGCGTGQVTTAVKERFPDAEVWGIDVAGPMARYAHHRASTMGVDVKFAQRLAEDTGFPSNHFDLVFDHIVFHEVTADAAKKIVEETNRVLRPGGVFHHLDIGTKGNPHAHMPKTVMEKGFYWMGHRLNIEPWFWVYMGSDFPRVMRERGFQVDLSVAANRSGIYPGVMGTKV